MGPDPGGGPQGRRPALSVTDRASRPRPRGAARRHLDRRSGLLRGLHGGGRRWLAGPVRRGGPRRRRPRPRGGRRATAGPSWLRAATSTCCSCTTRSGRRPRRAQALWYPIWDTGLKLGHAVRTVKEAPRPSPPSDLDTATSLLSCSPPRPATPPSPTSWPSRRLALWRKRSKRWLAEVAKSVQERHRQHGEVAFLLEPDLKEGRGGLRDVHALGWSEAARPQLGNGDPEAWPPRATSLLAVRVELHRRTGRPSDRLVAPGAGRGGRRPRLRRRRPAHGRRRPGGPHDRLDRRRGLGPHRVDPWPAPPADWPVPTAARPRRRPPRRRGPPRGRRRPGGRCPPSSCGSAVAAAQHDARIERRSLDRLAAEVPVFGDPWPEGHVACWPTSSWPVVPPSGCWRPSTSETCWCASSPSGSRCAAGRSATPTTSSPSTGTSGRPPSTPPPWPTSVHRHDLLVVGALLHDIGKGYPGDHTEVGIDLVRAHRPPAGLPATTTSRPWSPWSATTCCCPTSPPGATSDDDETIARGGRRRGLAGDPRAAGRAHRGRLAGHRSRRLGDLEGRPRGRAGRPRRLRPRRTDPPSPARRCSARSTASCMAEGGTHVLGEGRTLTVISRDRPGTFSRVAGVLAVTGLDVLEAIGPLRGDLGAQPLHRRARPTATPSTGRR